MIGRLKNAMRLQAQRALAESSVSKLGTVESYDPNYYAARVMLQEDQTLTGWLPIEAAWIGNGWGMFSPPNVGDMCTVVFVNGDLNSGYLEGRFWNDTDRPLPVPSGEFWLVHKSGAFFKLTNDGKVTFTDGQGATLQFDGAGNINTQANQWNHTGPMSIDGDVSITGDETVSGTVTGTTDVVGGGKSLKTHVHTGVQTGGGVSGPPQ